MMWMADPLFGHQNLKPGKEVKCNFWNLQRHTKVPASLKCGPDLWGRSHAESSICVYDGGQLSRTYMTPRQAAFFM